ncbi:hypothetical protein BH10BAC1_BH10BAC1_09560 [soil metagenome]
MFSIFLRLYFEIQSAFKLLPNYKHMNQMAIFLAAVLVYVIFGLFFLMTYFLTLRNGERKCRNSVSEFIMVFTEVIYTIIGPIIGFLRYDAYGPETPFAKQHVLTVILFVIVSSLSFWIARITSKTANPILRIIVSVGLLQGIVLCFITTIHFLAFIPLGIIYPILGFELLSPVFALLLLSRELYFYNKAVFNYDDAMPYRQELGFTPIPVKIIQAPFIPRMTIYGVLLIILIIFQMFLAFGCGQDIAAIVKAFTHSRGFIFSN